MLNLRLNAVSLLIDISGLANLKTIKSTKTHLIIGALVRHCDVITSLDIQRYAPLLVKAVQHIAHPAIRNRGTIGGSVALADPASEYPAVLLALEAEIITRSAQSIRRITAQDFFLGLYETALQEGEIVTAISIPLHSNMKYGFSELSRRQGDYAQCGVAMISYEKVGVKHLNIAYFSVADRPILAKAASEALLQNKPMLEAQTSLETTLDPMDQPDCSAKTKMHFAKILLKRVYGELQA